MIENLPDDSAAEEPARHLSEELQFALRGLREEYRQAFLLFHEQELSYIEIGAALDCPVGTVKTWVHRARRELIEHLRGAGCWRRNGMRCVEFERRMNELLDERAALDSDRELGEHAEQCAACADLLCGQELLLRGMATLCMTGSGRFDESAPDAESWSDGWSQPGMAEPLVGRRPAPAELAIRVAAELRSQCKSRLIWWWLVPALAASVLVAFAMGTRSPDNASTDNASPVAPVSSLAKQVPNESTPPQMESATTLTKSHWQSKWFSELGDSRYQWMDQVADGLKPVTDSVSAALHALRRTWPGSEPGARSSWSPTLRSDSDIVG